MLTLAAMVLLAGSPLLSFDVAELSYLNPQGSDRTSLSYLYHGSGSISLELGEKLLMEAFGADTSSGLTVSNLNSNHILKMNIQHSGLRLVWV